MRLKHVCIYLLLLCSATIFARPGTPFGAGVDGGIKPVATFLQELPITTSQTYVLSDQETKNLITLAAQTKINLFELLQCMYLFLDPEKKRVQVNGDVLMGLKKDFDYGKARMNNLIPINKIAYLQIGATHNPTENALDVYLTEPHTGWIEIATGEYAQHFGAKRIEKYFFYDLFGMTAKKWGFRLPLKKIELYDRGLGSFFVRGISYPKNLHLYLISKK